jgi:hypothetical protein
LTDDRCLGIKEHHPRVGDGIFDISIKVAMNTASSITNIIVSLALVVVSVVVVVRTWYEAP